jgi:hypothetical protein
VKGAPAETLGVVGKLWPEAKWRVLAFTKKHVLVWVWMPRSAKNRTAVIPDSDD